MNVLLILSALKKGWEYTKGFLALAVKYWYIVIITILLAIATSLRNDVNKLNAEKDALNSNIFALVQKQKTDLLEAQRADEHAYAEERTVSLYNALVDGEDDADNLIQIIKNNNNKK